ncbi:hypothetical protein Syun_001763 [Stephania yunnanensis]|uniref:Uncharacterized protein n=1 Tax=Stephania yunnanensis TaxID=152371 RepID=A0AAP0LFG2_9MAGN
MGLEPALGHHRLFNQCLRTVSPLLIFTSSSASSALTPSRFETILIASERDSSVYLAKFSTSTTLPVTGIFRRKLTSSNEIDISPKGR